MKIWVDADSCPTVIREILFKAANRTGVKLTLVANQPIAIPKSPLIKFIQVSMGFDQADNEIVRRVEFGDLVITSDIPLAAEVIEKSATVISARGELYTTENIRNRLQTRDMMESLRASGVETSRQSVFNQADRKTFAGKLDLILNRNT
jgi:uncharacterized protein YaiI (UPF0178 family)